MTATLIKHIQITAENQIRYQLDLLLSCCFGVAFTKFISHNNNSDLNLVNILIIISNCVEIALRLIISHLIIYLSWSDMSWENIF